MHGFRAAIVVVAALLSGACSRQAGWHLRDVRGIVPSLRIEGVGADGRPVRASTLAGHSVLLYFGYTHCPDVCPATLARLASAVRASASRAQIVFVSVDPARDTPAVLAQYASAFGPEVLGVHAEEGELADLSRRYRVSYSRTQPDAKGDYEVTHSSAVFVFDAAGHSRLLGTDANPASDYTADLVRLGHEAPPAL